MRAVTAVRDLSTFRRFIAVLATRCGQMFNRTDLAAPLGVSIPTISQSLSVFETTSIIALIPPYFDSAGKRIVKSPKMHFIDSGLACHLLGIETEPALRRSPFHGPLFEGFVASEITKQQLNAGRRREIYWFRDHQGLEVDFVVPELPTRTHGSEGLVLVKAKCGRTVQPSMADSMLKLAAGLGARPVRLFVVHGGAPQMTTALCRGVSAVDLGGLLDLLAPRSLPR
ncbi:MAG: DUF4143 domain-containing protein [Phycisphaerae bacterium]|nr:DUF4143 domain-containing protein [Phycisphaerae bacterium]